MLARSFAHSVLVVLAFAACKKAPEADPAKVTTLAQAILANRPMPAALAKCKVEDLQAPALTLRTVALLAKETIGDNVAEGQAWINPAVLDLPAAQTLLTSNDETERRRAAATVLAQKSFAVALVDLVNVPLALEVKELKRGVVGMRAVVYDRSGTPLCVTVFNVQNDKALSDWAMKNSTRAVVDPEVAKKLREDLTQQLIARWAQLKQTGA